MASTEFAEVHTTRPERHIIWSGGSKRWTDKTTQGCCVSGPNGGGRNASVRDSPPDWVTVLALIEAAAPRLQEDSCTLRDLLERSENQLGLPDPLLCDLGVHRWLDEETSYFNWLAWALERLRDPSLILDVLGIKSVEFGS